MQLAQSDSIEGNSLSEDMVWNTYSWQDQIGCHPLYILHLFAELDYF